MTKSNLKKKKEVYLAYGSSGLGPIMAGKVRHGDRSWKLTVDILSTHKKQRENEVRRSYKPSKPTYLQWYTSSSKAWLPKGSITSPQSATNWGPRIQIQEPKGVHFSLKPWQSTIPFSFLKYCHYFVLAKGLGQFFQVSPFLFEFSAISRLVSPHSKLSTSHVTWP